MEDDWIQETEARYESMKTSLHSMRHDIDILRQRLDNTEELGFETPSSSSVQHPDPENNYPDRNLAISHEPIQPFYQPDLLSNLGSVDDLWEPDEYMDIRIRSSDSPFKSSPKDEKLLDCEVTPKIGIVSPECKTWKSPSDFSTRDPFDDDIMKQEFTNIKCSCNAETHQHDPTMETDLDDLTSDKSEHANDSEGSLSPAVSPTFGNYSSSDEVKLQNIVISSDDNITFPITRSKEVEKGNEYQVYDNDHSLTTIEEASEEIEDEWSSSDVDLSLHEPDRLSKKNASRAHSASIKPSGLSNVSKKEKQSIKAEFKSSYTKQVEDSGLASDLTNCSTLEFSLSNEQIQIRKLSDSNVSDVPAFNEKLMSASESGPVVTEAIRLRHKQTELNNTVNNSRPMSADAKKILKQLEKSHSGSLRSVNSTVSQESMISEAESYVTVRSHIAYTGSEEAYTTAYSDSDTPLNKSHAKGDLSDPDECPTLSRKRTKGSFNQRLLKKDAESTAFSGSDTEDEEKNYATTPVPITVTPKFIKLPSRLCTSGDYSQESNFDNDDKPDSSSTIQKEFIGGVFNDKDDLAEKDLPNKTSGNNQNQTTHTPYKRFQFRRPNRHQISDEGTESPQSSDSEGKPADASSSSSSSEEFEAYYDTSKPGLWKSNPNDQWSGVLLPNLIHKPNIPLDNLNLPLDIRAKKRLSSIEETSSNSLVDTLPSDIEENNSSNSVANLELNDPVVVVPKFSNLNQAENDTLEISKHASSCQPDHGTTNQITVAMTTTNTDNLQKHEPINDQRALTQSNTLLVKNYKPVTPHKDHGQVEQITPDKVRLHLNSAHDANEFRPLLGSSRQGSDGDKSNADQLKKGDTLETSEMPGIRSPFHQKQHYFPRRSTNPTPPTLLPKPNYPLLKQNGHNQIFSNQTKPPVPNSAKNNASIPNSGVKNESTILDSTDYSNARQELGQESFSEMYDNEFQSYRTTGLDDFQRPSLVEDQSRPNTSSRYSQNLSSNNWKSHLNEPQFAFRQFVPVHASYESTDMSHDLYSNIEVDDIKPASQRTSRIMKGTPEYLGASLDVSDLTPKQPERAFIQISEEKLPTPIIAHLTSPQIQKDSGSIVAEDLTNQVSASFDAESDATNVPNKLRHPETIPQHGQVQLMRAPQITSPSKPQSVHLESSPGRQRNSSPSPPRNAYRPYTNIVTSKPPSLVANRTRWQLKSIPTDNEIRERLRSRSRQRAEERQSRSAHPNEQTNYRPRNSRSDSRYRCTDLDSAIAESRADTLETSGPFVTDSEPHSEARQSASLFDLDAHTQKVSAHFINNQKYACPLQNGVKQTVENGKRLLGDAKSYNSLLETDIDTGENFERPIVLETDLDKLDTKMNTEIFDAAVVDQYENKTRSLFNLALAHTPATFRRQTAPGLSNTGDTDGMVELIQSPTTNQYDWQRTKSYQGLSQRDPDPVQASGVKTTNSLGSKHQSRFGGSGARGLIDRLRDKARSTHELRIAQSLTKLHIPEWLDKADYFQSTAMTTSMTTRYDTADYKPQFRHTELKTTTQSPLNTRSRPILTSLRSLSSVPKASNLLAAGSTSAVETVAEPTWPKPANLQTKFVRPSLALRQKTEQSIKPITSKLYSSMRSLSSQRRPLEDYKQGDIRPQVAPRANRSLGQGTVIELGPQDFVPKHEQLWGREQIGHIRDGRAVTEPPRSITSNTTMKEENLQYGSLNDPVYINYNPTISNINLVSCPNQQMLEKPHHLVTQSISDIKDVDYDSGTEHSSERNAINTKKDPTEKIPPEKPVAPQKVNGMSTLKDVKHLSNGNNRSDVLKDDQSWNIGPSESETSGLDTKRAKPTESEWAPADVDGETESEVTDGLDQISDLTCLTSLVDSCASRHRTLLANRPSALEHLLTGLGWWPDSPSVEHRYLPPTAAETISIAAHEFDIREDSHRHEYIRLLASPNSRRPINLGEFGLNQLSGVIQRRPEDGLLYMRCGRPECTTTPVRVDQVSSWCACTNCFTLYCSPNCRSASERTMQDHPMHCSFARAKRVCSRILRNLAPGQLTGLTALAKTGMARLGRGGILLPFALVRHAEIFLQKSLTQSFINEASSEIILEEAAHKWEKFHQPSPGGLLAPPIYLTLNELEELDSTVANPCRTYSPSNSMVLIVVICAYELIARSDGRPVHLFKQSLIVPFPSSHINSTKKLEQQNEAIAKSSAAAVNMNRSSQQSVAAREAYMIRLQRMLRERGVSLRHHHPDIYTQLAHFVETGIPFAPIRITFHDFVMKEEVLCTINPMSDLHIQPLRDLGSQTQQPQSMMKSNQQLGDRQLTETNTNLMKTPRPTTESVSQSHQSRSYSETNF